MQLLNVQIQDDEAAIERFEQAWAAGNTPDIVDYVRDDFEGFARLLAELALVDADWRRRTAQEVSVSFYLSRFPELREHHRFLQEYSRDCSQASETGGPRDSLLETSLSSSPLPRLARFECLEEVGSGGFGTVYRARDTKLGRDVAIKIPRSGSFANESELKRFAREAKHAGQLRHAGIVPVYEVGKSEGIAYLVSELVDGETLAEAMSHRDFSQAEAVEIVAQVAEALDHAHNLGIVHRDIKPSNILLETRKIHDASDPQRSGRLNRRPATLPYEIRITDFGLSRNLGTDESLSADAQLIGTLAYMSPEQASGKAGEADARSDVFSVGIVFYELLSGVRPFVGRHANLLEQIQSIEPTPLRERARNTHRDLETICWKCLRKSPTKRYASTGELAEDLRRWQRQEPIAARRATLAERLASTVRRHPLSWAAATFVLLLLCSALVGLKIHNARLLHEALRADRNADTAEWRLYVSNMNLASEAWSQGLVGRVRELLEPFRAPLPGKDLRGWEWHYLWAQSHTEQEVVRLTNEPLVASAIAANLQAGVAATEMGNLILWSDKSEPAVLKIKRSGAPIRTLAISSSGSLIVAGCDDGVLEIWSATEGEKTKSWRGHSSRIHGVSVSADGKHLATCAADGQVALWSFESEEPIWSFRAFHSEPVQVALQPNDPRNFLVLTDDGVLRAWRQDEDRERLTFNATRASYSHFAISPNSHMVAGGCPDGVIHLFDMQSGDTIHTIDEVAEPITYLAFDETSTYLACGRVKGSVDVWSVKSGRLAHTIIGHESTIASTAFSDELRTLTAIGTDGTFRNWPFQPRDSPLDHQPASRVLSLRAHAAENAFAAINESGQYFEYRFDSQAVATSFHFQHGEVIRAADFSHERNTVASGDDFGGLIFWDTVTGAQKDTRGPKRNPISAIEFERLGERFATGSEDGTVRLWNLSSKEILSVHDDFTSPISALCFDRERSRLACGCQDGSLALWHRTGDAPRTITRAHSGTISDIAFSNNGEQLATSGSDRRVKIWDAGSGDLQHSLPGHASPVNCLCFNADDSRLFTGDEAGKLRCWDPSSGEMLLAIASSDHPWRQVSYLESSDSLLAGGDSKIYCFSAHAAYAKLAIPKEIAFPQQAGAWKRNLDSWNIVRWPDMSPEQYHRGLELAKQAYAMMPDEPWVKLTLGVANYRTGNLTEALDLLFESRQGDREAYFSIAFEVMAAYKLSRQDTVADGLRQLRHAARSDGWKIDPNFASQYREVLKLVHGDGLVPDQGWKVGCYEWRLANADLSPKDFGAVASKPPQVEISANTLSFDWGREPPAAGVAANYFATVSEADFDLAAGNYEIQLVSKNGVRVFQDDRLIVDNWNPEHAKIAIYPFRFSGGDTTLRVEHYKLDGPAYLEFRILPSGTSKDASNR